MTQRLKIANGRTMHTHTREHITASNNVAIDWWTCLLKLFETSKRPTSKQAASSEWFVYGAEEYQILAHFTFFTDFCKICMKTALSNFKLYSRKHSRWFLSNSMSDLWTGFIVAVIVRVIKMKYGAQVVGPLHKTGEYRWAMTTV